MEKVIRKIRWSVKSLRYVRSMRSRDLWKLWDLWDLWDLFDLIYCRSEYLGSLPQSDCPSVAVVGTWDDRTSKHCLNPSLRVLSDSVGYYNLLIFKLAIGTQVRVYHNRHFSFQSLGSALKSILDTPRMSPVKVFFELDVSKWSQKHHTFSRFPLLHYNKKYLQIPNFFEIVYKKRSTA